MKITKIFAETVFLTMTVIETMTRTMSMTMSMIEIRTMTLDRVYSRELDVLVNSFRSFIYDCLPICLLIYSSFYHSINFRRLRQSAQQRTECPHLVSLVSLSPPSMLLSMSPTTSTTITTTGKCSLICILSQIKRLKQTF